MSEKSEYKIVPFKPEQVESMTARFPAALCQIPGPPTRQHTFDFASHGNVRMIASLEQFGTKKWIHLSFGVPSWNKVIHSDRELQEAALTLVVHFVGFKNPDTLQTNKAFHLFYPV